MSAYAVRITRGLVTHWLEAPLETWEQANECRAAIERMTGEVGYVEEVLLCVPAPHGGADSGAGGGTQP